MKHLLGVFVCAWCICAQAATHDITGSRTMYPLSIALAERFARTHPGSEIRVAEDGTSKGIEALLAGTTDAAAVTRPLRPEEKKQFKAKGKPEPIEVDVAVEGISIYVHPRNSVSTLSTSQLQKIFSGEITDWGEVGGPAGPIHVYSFDRTTGRYWYVLENVLQKKQFAASTRFARSTATKPSENLAEQQRQMLEEIAADPAAIGYGDLKKVRLAKIVRVSTSGIGYWPTPDDLQSGRYPLARRLMFLLPPKPDPVVADFVRWAGAQEDLIRAFDFVPLRK